MRLWARRQLAAAGAFALLAPQGARAQQPVPGAAGAAGPWLRIETGAHGARSIDAAIDMAGRLLLTGSDDKTARLWSLPELRPLGVLRPPIGPDQEGRVYAVALSSDGRRAALGGWIGAGPHDVLVFDLRTRQVERRLAGLPRRINALAFSADGVRLAAGLSGANGIRLWRVADGAELPGDPDYRDSVYGLAFAPDGRLAAAGIDGALRLYDAAGQRLRRVETEAARQPFRLRFSPDGRLLAVGFADAAALEVRDGTTLALRSRPDVTGLNGADLTSVGWSADGATLYAGGDSWQGGSRPVFAWAEQGRGRRRLAAAGFTDGSASILPLAGGRLAFTSIAGDIAVVGADGSRLATQRSGAGDLARPQGDFGSPAWRLWLGRDGRLVQWVFWDAQDRWRRFDAAALELTAGQSPLGGLADWAAEVPGLQVTDWASRPDPQLNGRPLALEPYERSRSVAVAPGRVLLGASWALRLFGPDGQPVWARPVPGEAWRVNQSPDGRLAVAALGDGTIRWYRLRDGQELLALFVAPRDERWVAFTPSGYFAASTGGEELIGWQLNRGPEQAADFFPASRFRERFFRPDVVGRVLEALDEVRALGLADAARGATPSSRAPSAAALAEESRRAVEAEPPPTLVLEQPLLRPDQAAAAPGGRLDLVFRVRSPARRPIERWAVLLDGEPLREVPAPRPQPLQPGEDPTVDSRWALGLVLPPGPARSRPLELVLRADPRGGGFGEPQRLLVQPSAQPQATSGPWLRALLVGVSEYQKEAYRRGVANAWKDAEDIRAELEKQRGRSLYGSNLDIQVLSRADATLDGIRQEMLRLAEASLNGDSVVVLLAGHGVVSRGGTVYFLPADGDANPRAPHGIPQHQLNEWLSQIVGHRMVLLDFCHSGGAIQSPVGQDLTGLVNGLQRPGQTLVCLAAARASDVTQEQDGNGALTRAVLGVLREPPPSARQEGHLYVNQLVSTVWSGLINQLGPSRAPTPLLDDEGNRRRLIAIQ